jgi:hypothetical protein
LVTVTVTVTVLVRTQRDERSEVEKTVAAHVTGAKGRPSYTMLLNTIGRKAVFLRLLWISIWHATDAKGVTIFSAFLVFFFFGCSGLAASALRRFLRVGRYAHGLQPHLSTRVGVKSVLESVLRSEKVP